MPHRYFVYILASKRNGTLYIGVTNDLVKRVFEHKSGRVEGFTKKYGVHRLVWYDETSDVALAIQREKTMKHWVRAWKINAIEKTNPEWRDLYDEIAGGCCAGKMGPRDKPEDDTHYFVILGLVPRDPNADPGSRQSMLQILETISEPGHPDKPNEDAFGHGPAHAWVIDGATGVGDGELLGDLSDAHWLSREAAKYFAAEAQAHDGDLHGLTRAAIGEMARRFEVERLRAPKGRFELPSAAMALVHWDGATLACAGFADCGLILLGDDGGVKHFGDPRGESAPAAQRRIADLMSHVGAGEDSRTSPDVMRYLQAQRNRQNTEDGYWIFGLDPRAVDFMRHGRVALEGPATGLLMSDGFAALAHDYGRLGDGDFVRRARDEGLRALLAEVRKIERDEDPEMRRYPRFKRSDDATAVLFRVTPTGPAEALKQR